MTHQGVFVDASGRILVPKWSYHQAALLAAWRNGYEKGIGEMGVIKLRMGPALEEDRINLEFEMFIRERDRFIYKILTKRQLNSKFGREAAQKLGR